MGTTGMCSSGCDLYSARRSLIFQAGLTRPSLSVVDELREIVDAIAAHDLRSAEKAAVAHVKMRGREAAQFLERNFGP